MNPDSVPQPLYQVHIDAPVALAEHLQSGLELAGHTAVINTRPHDLTAGIEIFCDTLASANQLAEQMRSLTAVSPVFAGINVAVNKVDGTELTNRWRTYFHTTHVGSRFVIRPDWEPYTPAPNERVISLEPGLSFGTGRHPTTRGCLILLEALAETHTGGTLLDLGCGSGILTIAGALLGFTSIRGIDNDPQAIGKAKENAALNGLHETLCFEQAEIKDAATRGSFDIVICNVLDGIIRDNAEAIITSVATPHGFLILSGILRENCDATLVPFLRKHFILQRHIEEEEWVTCLLSLHRQQDAALPSRT